MDIADQIGKLLRTDVTVPTPLGEMRISLKRGDVRGSEVKREGVGEDLTRTLDYKRRWRIGFEIGEQYLNHTAEGDTEIVKINRQSVAYIAGTINVMPNCGNKINHIGARKCGTKGDSVTPAVNGELKQTLAPIIEAIWEALASDASEYADRNAVIAGQIVYIRGQMDRARYNAQDILITESTEIVERAEDAAHREINERALNCAQLFADTTACVQIEVDKALAKVASTS